MTDLEDSFVLFPEIDEEKREVAGIYLTTAGLLFWFYVLATQRIWWVPPTYPLGLYQVISPLFWIGITFVTAGTLIRIDSKKKHYFIFQILVLQLMIWVTPSIMQSNARVTDSWGHFAITQALMEGITEIARGGVYVNWPGSFIFGGSLLGVTGMEVMSFLRFFPLLSSSVFILGFFLFMERMAGKTAISRCSILLFLPLNVWLQFHYSPHAFALMLFPISMIGIFFIKDHRWLFISVFLIIITAISHPTTSIFFGAMVVSIFFVRVIRPTEDNRKILAPLGALSFIILALTMVLLIYSGMLKRVLVGDLFWGVPPLIRDLIIERFSKPVSAIRGIVLLFTTVISLIGIWINRHQREMFSLTLGGFIGITGVLLLALAIPGAYFHQRAFIYYYFFISFLVVTMIFSIAREDRGNKYKRIYKINKRVFYKYIRIIFILLIAVSFLNLTTVFTAENEAIVSDSCLRSLDFLIEHTEEENVYGGRTIQPLRSFQPQRMAGSIFANILFQESCIVIIDEYSLISENTGRRTVYVQIWTQNRNSTCVYSGGGFEIYNLD